MTAVTYVTFLLTRQYTKNPELCSLRCGDEFGLELNWNGALNYYKQAVKFFFVAGKCNKVRTVTPSQTLSKTTTPSTLDARGLLARQRQGTSE